MMMECVMLEGKVINIGPWDYQMVGDEATNPLPEGAEIVELEVLEREDGSMYAVGYEPTKSPAEEISELKQLVADLAALQLGV